MRKRLGRTVQGLAVLAGLLLVLFIVALLRPPHQVLVPLPKATVSPEPAPTAIAVTPPELAAYATIDERPPFNPTRRPFQKPETQVEEAPPPPPSAILVGVMIDHDKRFAMLKLGNAVETRTVGEELNGWTIALIEPEKVELTQEQRSQTYPLQGVEAAKAGVGVVKAVSSADSTR